MKEEEIAQINELDDNLIEELTSQLLEAANDIPLIQLATVENSSDSTTRVQQQVNLKINSSKDKQRKLEEEAKDTKKNGSKERG